jgi:hypothetical protein
MEMDASIDEAQVVKINPGAFNRAGGDGGRQASVASHPDNRPRAPRQR